MEYIVPKLDQQRYGLGFEILASSNQSSPSCLSTTFGQSKHMFTVGNREFAAVYEEKICDPIGSAISALLPNRRWALNVFRLGYEEEKLQNPIVIHLVVNCNGPDTGSSITDAQAGELVPTIVAAIENSGWKGEE